MESNKGWLKVHRKFLDWEWFDKPEMVQFFFYILLSANYEDKKWHGITVARGQLVTSSCSLKSKLNLSTQQIRTCIARLELSGEITKKSTNKYTIITICNYDAYQSLETNEQQTNNKQTTNEQQTNNKRTTTTKEYKEIKKERKKENIYNNYASFSENFFEKNQVDDVDEEKEEKEEKECITPYLEYEINTIANRAFLDTFWIESIQMNLASNKIQKTPLEIANLGTHYANQLRADGENKISMKTFKFRFSRWVLKFLKNINDENKTKSYNSTKQAWRNGIDGEALPEGSYSGGVF